jgi:hypothetical protein
MGVAHQVEQSLLEALGPYDRLIGFGLTLAYRADRPAGIYAAAPVATVYVRTSGIGRLEETLGPTLMTLIFDF